MLNLVKEIKQNEAFSYYDFALLEFDEYSLAHKSFSNALYWRVLGLPNSDAELAELARS